MPTKKIKYSSDFKNRLSIINITQSGNSKKQIVPGNFGFKYPNRLCFFLDKKYAIANGMPEHIEFEGRWMFTQNFDLKFKITETKNVLSSDIVITGEIIDIDKKGLLFLFKTEVFNKEKLNIIELKGSWNVDEKNRITLILLKEKEKQNELVFSFAWTLNNKHEIVFAYKKRIEKTKIVLEKQIVFRGEWFVFGSNRIGFYVNLSNDSPIFFNARLLTRCVKEKGTPVKYEIGIGRKNIKRTLVFFGKWRFMSGNVIGYELRYKKTVYFIKFDFEINQIKKTKIKLSLISKHSKLDGAEIEFSKNIFGADFLATSKISKDEKNIIFGLTKKF